MPDELVPLCQCWDMVEAHSIRASFEARGVRAHIDGEHHRSMLGMFGAAIELRIMVPASQLAVARELAAEIIPDLAPDEDDEDEEPLGSDISPARRPPAEDLVDYPDEPSDDEDDDDEDEERPLKKSIRLAKILFSSGLAIGTIHIYADRLNQGLVLLFAAALGLALVLGGEPWGLLLIVTVWVLDAGYGIPLLREHNRKLEARAELAESAD